VRHRWLGPLGPSYTFSQSSIVPYIRPFGVPVAAGILYPTFGILLNPVIAALAMALSSVSVVGNAVHLRTARL